MIFGYRAHSRDSANGHSGVSRTPAQFCFKYSPICTHSFKKTASPDIGLQFSLWKIKLVLSAGPLMVLTFFYFVVPEIFKN
jgi:hypothetical protein